MDRLNRTETQYLKLFTQEHECLIEEKSLLHDYSVKEEEERELFYRLSTLLREAQEKERARAERIKYLQFALSLACTFLGLCSAFLISFLRRSELKDILNHEKNSFDNLAIKINEFDNEQREFNQILKNVFFIEQLGNDNKKLLNIKDLFDNQINIINSHFELLKSNEINLTSDSNLNVKLYQQQYLLKIISITSVLSAFFLIVGYFSK